MKTCNRFLLTAFCGVYTFFGICLSGQSQNLTCTFTIDEIACLEQHVNVIYTGNAPDTTTYIWDFDDAVIILGSGQGPYWVKWLTTGEKHVTLTVNYNGQTCTHDQTIQIVEIPAEYYMTGGGSYPQGGIGVPVGLDGSQTGVLYKLRRNGLYTDITKAGTGNPIEFGFQTIQGYYDCIAQIDGSQCIKEMNGSATVTIVESILQLICMVTYDTLTDHNNILWNRIESGYLSHVNIYRETYQNNSYEKIGEVPYSSLSVYTDTTSNPMVKSDKYKLSLTDTAGNEYDKSQHHKTIHLNISPGIYGFNLIWNHYEGFEFLTYKIFRKLGAEAFVLLDSVASNVDSYTDPYITSGIATYFIGVVRPEPCEPSLKSNEYSMTHSNVATAAPLGISGEDGNGILVYPNPVQDRLIIFVPDNKDVSWSAEIYQPDGRQMYKSHVGGGASVVEVSTFQSGLYILKLKGESTLVMKKFVKD